jgi:hypothetical protein
MIKLATSLALIFALGSSASAATRTRYRTDHDRDDRFSERRYDRTRGLRDDFGPRRYRSAWVALGELDRRGGALDVFDRGTFTQLRFQVAGNAGAARLDDVVIQFHDGTEQRVVARRVIDGPELFEIQLDGNNRRIDRVMVSARTRGATLQVFGL